MRAVLPIPLPPAPPCPAAYPPRAKRWSGSRRGRPAARLGTGYSAELRSARFWCVGTPPRQPVRVCVCVCRKVQNIFFGGKNVKQTILKIIIFLKQ